MAETFASKLITSNYSSLMQVLPMSDPNFVEILCRCELLTKNVKLDLQTMTKSIEKASYFLDNLLKPGLDDEKIFKLLLTAMKSSDDETVKDLAYDLQVKLLLKNLSSKHLISRILYGAKF